MGRSRAEGADYVGIPYNATPHTGGFAALLPLLSMGNRTLYLGVYQWSMRPGYCPSGWSTGLQEGMTDITQTMMVYYLRAGWNWGLFNHRPHAHNALITLKKQGD